MPNDDDTRRAPKAALDMAPDEFRALGHALVDRIAGFLGELRDLPVAPDATPGAVRQRLGQGGLPETGADDAALLDEAFDLAAHHNRLTAHPRQWGYVIGSAAPLGALGDLLAATVNPNVVSWASAPMATEIELQAVRWTADLLGYPADCGGLFTSGGTMANTVGLLAARTAQAGREVRSEGVGGRRLRVYCSGETHTWIETAADMCGLGTDAIRWIDTDADRRIDLAALEARIAEDRAAGDRPFLVIGNAGTVMTGAVDPLPRMAALARTHGLWFHVDGAYGGLAVAAPGAPADLAGLRAADSVAVDAHKWLYAPLEAGCVLVRDRQALIDSFSYRPPYYHYAQNEGEALVHFNELGPQTSRGFRALKVWLILRRLGRAGYARLVAADLANAQAMHRHLAEAPEIEAATLGLSIATFRYVPADLAPGTDGVDAYLDRLNDALLARIQHSGEAYLSNAVLAGRFYLRACITNFRTAAADVAALPEIVARHGRALDAELRPAEPRRGGAA